MDDLYTELKRRNVFRVATIYVVVAWLLAQVVMLAVDAFAAPDWVIRIFIGILIAGFPVALVLAWAFELTPEGIKLEKNVDRSKSNTQGSGKRLDFMIVGILLIALAYSLIIRYENSRDVVRPPIVDHALERKKE